MTEETKIAIDSEERAEDSSESYCDCRPSGEMKLILLLWTMCSFLLLASLLHVNTIANTI